MPFHPLWLVVILAVVLIIFGPGRLPELGGALGKAMREFRKATSEITSQVTDATKTEPAPTEAAKSSTSETKPTGN